MAAQQDFTALEGLNVREYQPKDRETVLRIWQDCNLFPDASGADAQNELTIAGLLSTGQIFVGECDGSIVSTVFVATTGVNAWIWDLAVEPQLQGFGYGVKMVSEAERWARLNGAHRMMLFVMPDNADVIGFYQKDGYSEMDVTVLSKPL